ncbi:MAG: hypothetical protein HQL57_06075 [Magnetococcales bacterium]|nr:hypothetical protein [Magnetococcales bacterium]
MSYQDIGGVRHPSRPVVANVTDRQYRRIVVYQKRWLLDNPLINVLPNNPLLLPVKDFLARRFRKATGLFWILCIAQHQRTIPPNAPTNPMIGKLYLFDRKGWKGKVETAVRGMQDRLIDGNNNQEKNLEADPADIDGLCRRSADVCADFLMERDGTVTLQLPENGICVPTDVPDRVVAQLYFFLKDISHEHLHHTPTTDTLTELYPIGTKNGGDNTEDTNDNEWRYRTLARLLRKVFRYSREARPSSYDDAVGILAFAKTFRHISAKALREQGNEEEKISEILPQLQIDDLERSIQANKEARASRLQHVREHLDSIKTSLFFIVGTVIGCAGLIQVAKYEFVGVNISWFLIAITKFLLEYPVHFAGGLLFLYFLYANLTERISIGNKDYINNLSRLLAPLGNKWQAGIAFALVGAIQFFMYLLAFGK